VGRSTDISSPRKDGPTEPHTAPATLYLAALFLSIAFHASPGCQSQQPLRAPETFDDVYEQREALRDSVITLAGRFMGWEGAGCVFPAYAARQATRSDWIFRIGDTCLYVTGGSPPDLSPMDTTSPGKQITLEARIRSTADGKLLLEYVRSTPMSQER
jgi:hypothetical protein